MVKIFGGDLIMWVEVYDEKYRLNMKLGKNFDKVLGKITPLIKKIAAQYIESFTFIELDDLEQDLYVMALEGLGKFNKDKGVKLSTFMHHHLENKLITKLKSDHSEKRNASFHHLKKREDGTFWSDRPISLNFSVSEGKGMLKQTAQSILPSQCSIYQYKNVFDVVDFRLSLVSLFEKYPKILNKSVRNNLEALYFEDKYVKDTLPAISDGVMLGEEAMRVRLKIAGRMLGDLKLNEERSGDIQSSSHLNNLFFLRGI